jgi:hypothetical protein
VRKDQTAILALTRINSQNSKNASLLWNAVRLLFWMYGVAASGTFGILDEFWSWSGRPLTKIMRTTIRTAYLHFEKRGRFGCHIMRGCKFGRRSNLTLVMKDIHHTAAGGAVLRSGVRIPI